MNVKDTFKNIKNSYLPKLLKGSFCLCNEGFCLCNEYISNCTAFVQKNCNMIFFFLFQIAQPNFCHPHILAITSSKSFCNSGVCGIYTVFLILCHIRRQAHSLAWISERFLQRTPYPLARVVWDGCKHKQELLICQCCHANVCQWFC